MNAMLFYGMKQNIQNVKLYFREITLLSEFLKSSCIAIVIHHYREPYRMQAEIVRHSRYLCKKRERAASISQTTHGERRKKELRAARYVGKHRGRNYKRMRYDEDGKRNSNTRNASARNVVVKKEGSFS